MILSAASARRRLLILSATRWLPVGLTFGLTTLIPLQRGIGLAEIGVILSAQGFVMLALELPTGGFADTLGRRPVLVLAGLIGAVSATIFLLAHDLWAFVLALALQGVFRALDSGPLESWYVDAALADDPDTAVDQSLSQAATVLGMAIAGGALVSGGLIAWHPLPGSALTLPYAVSIVLGAVHVVLTVVLVREPGRDRAGVAAALATAKAAPRVVADGLRTLRSRRVLRTLVLVEVFWSLGMIGFEMLTPIRLTELVGGENRAGAIFGPSSAAAWGLFAVGSLLAGLTSRRLGVARTAMISRVTNGAFVMLMGLAAGPVGLISAYLLAYLTHGAAGPMHATLLHRQAESGNRATVLSMNSMIAGGTYSLGLLAVGPLAAHTSTGTAILVTGAFSILGVFTYLPARREEHETTTDATNAGRAQLKSAAQ
ncbi:MAG: MFS transporter [Microlunatus sp.]|nr:MFS transporter [Microlunatus sp.]